jgi:FtsP/CotA-like multicopper oxidase with cupredoxin domain
MLLGAAACSGDVAESEPIELHAEALASSCAPDVPDALKVPAGNKLDFAADAEGVQIYVCQASATDGSLAWALKAPDAQLFGKRGHLIGTHYAGPTWEARDGSTVVGSRLAAATPDATAIPWLLLQAASTTGDGLMSKVTYIQRLDTVGGLAPQTGCDAGHPGATVESAYSATYYFYKAAARGRH